MSTPKKHHYISACYLKNFAEPAKRAGKIYVINKTEKKRFISKPEDIACEMYFNALSEENLSELEKALGDSDLENDFAKIIEEIKENTQLPAVGSDSFDVLLNFIALFAIRNPAARQQKEAFFSQTYKIALSMCQDIKGDPRKILSNTGLTFPNNVTPEQIHRLIKKEEYDLRFPKGYHVQLEFELHDRLLNCLLERNWGLLQYTETEEFITSDGPVTLAPTSSKLNGIPLGYALKDTQVIFPLTLNTRHTSMQAERYV